MIADTLRSAQLRSRVTDRNMFLRALTLLPGLVLGWMLSASAIPATIWYGVMAYCVAQLVLTIGMPQTNRRALISMEALFIVADLSFSALLIAQAATLGGTIFPLYLLISLRVLARYRLSPAATVTPFLLGPLYLFALYSAAQLSSLSPVQSLSGWGLLIGSLGFGVVAIWTASNQQRDNGTMRDQLRNERQIREARVEELERITGELRARMRERHALEEGLRVITSSLSVTDVLTHILESTVQTFGHERIHAMALSLQAEHGLVHHTFAQHSETMFGWADSVSRQTMSHASPTVVADAALSPDIAAVADEGFRAVLSVPLYVGEGQARGALTVVSKTFAAFSSSDARHLSAFAAQAGIAIGNAELHSQIHRQQRLLNAVMRDISDGLVVLDSANAIVMANPLGTQLLTRVSSHRSIRDHLLDLAASVDSNTVASAATAELKVQPEQPDEQPRYYQAIATQVHRDDSDDPLVAVVFHDITDQKAEELARVEFISMVSHELRNPVHTLNGFLKVVLQGRAGALTALQLDFLQMADAQTEQLKGRIAELLEFNKMRAGRLTLAPDWNDLSALVTDMLNRLQLSAEERGLTLYNRVDPALPEAFFDGPRIGQVVTNLTENAFKATPQGGSVTVSSEYHDHEIWVRIRDTGVGIPAAELPKIFQRFYRVAKHTRGPDSHLGLGLAICQQIVEGHGGRLWVESEEGVGTCFTFSLPLIPTIEAVEA